MSAIKTESVRPGGGQEGNWGHCGIKYALVKG